MLRRVLMVGVVAIAMLSDHGHGQRRLASLGWLLRWYGGPVLGWTGYDYGYYAWGGWGAGCCDYGWYRPAYVPAYTSCYTPCYSSCYDPCYRGCSGLGRVAYRWRTHHYGYYWGCSSPCWSVSRLLFDVRRRSGLRLRHRRRRRAVRRAIGRARKHTGWPDPGGSARRAKGRADPTPEKQTLRQSNSALLTVSVPADARVLVNGVPTRSTGDVRRYVSRNLNPGFSYTYEVTTEATVNGSAGDPDQDRAFAGGR